MSIGVADWGTISIGPVMSKTSTLFGAFRLGHPTSLWGNHQNADVSHKVVGDVEADFLVGMPLHTKKSGARATKVVHPPLLPPAVTLWVQVFCTCEYWRCVKQPLIGNQDW